MIPLRDVIPSRTFPFFTISFIVLNTIAFLFEQSLSGPALEQFVHVYGVVPARLAPITVFTSMFLHAGWGHFLGNMLFLWIFGDNVEDRVGHAPVRRLLFLVRYRRRRRARLHEPDVEDSDDRRERRDRRSAWRIFRPLSALARAGAPAALHHLGSRRGARRSCFSECGS